MSPVGVLDVDAVDLARVGEVRERPEHQPVDHPEHRRVGTDAESESDDDGGRESGRAADAPDSVAEVLLELVEPGPTPAFPSGFPRLGHVAEPAASGLGGRVGRGTVGQRLLLQLFRVEAEFVSQFSIELVATEPMYVMLP